MLDLARVELRRVLSRESDREQTLPRITSGRRLARRPQVDRRGWDAVATQRCGTLGHVNEHEIPQRTVPADGRRSHPALADLAFSGGTYSVPRLRTGPQTLSHPQTGKSRDYSSS